MPPVLIERIVDSSEPGKAPQTPQAPQDPQEQQDYDHDLVSFDDNRRLPDQEATGIFVYFGEPGTSQELELPAMGLALEQNIEEQEGPPLPTQKPDGPDLQNLDAWCAARGITGAERRRLKKKQQRCNRRQRDRDLPT
ncbi:hypothetical protein FOCC_FOCC013177 [Frankliniella occidentalis]|nr:hypothetical protein FOCC_FOCC013177 [Frankliniella occidentalis]